ncbi:MAG TPA: nitroreductase family protein [Verrucomicrobiae bacterium]|nr:nitroreductase family protein [Verrucomicrobiae bacterium]
MNQVIQCINNRVSLRKYSAEPLTPEHTQAILHSALRAPTAGNMMLYSILQITEQEVKNTLAKTCDDQPFIAKAPLVLVFLADLQRWYDYYQSAGVKEFCTQTGRDFTGPDEGALFLASSDALIAAQNAVIAGESLGVGSCYIGDIMERYEDHRQIFDLPPWTFPVAMLCMGYYPAELRPEPRERLAQNHVVFENKYKRFDPSTLDEIFAFRHKEFTQQNPYGAQNLAQVVYARKTGADYAKEMGRSVRLALKNWQGERL